MEGLLKSTFPTHKILDASDKSNKERDVIIQLCIRIPTIIMFVAKNHNNKQFFKRYEKKHNTKNIHYIFFNKDDYIYMKSDQVDKQGSKGIVIFLRNYLNKNECICSICLEEFNPDGKSILICDTCGNSVCKKCVLLYLSKTEKDEMKCPVCKSSVLASIEHI